MTGCTPSGNEVQFIIEPGNARWQPSTSYGAASVVSHPRLSDGAMRKWTDGVGHTSGAVWDAAEEAQWSESALYTFDASSEMYRIEAETLTDSTRKWIAANPFTGSLQFQATDRRLGPYVPAGWTTFRLRPGELATLLVHLIGTESPSGTFKSLDSDPPYCGIMIHRVTEVWEYQDMRPARIVLRTRASGIQGDAPVPAELSVLWMGCNFVRGATWPGSPPSLGTGDEFKPLIFEESVLTIDSAIYKKQDLVLDINYGMVPEFMDSNLYPSDVCRRGFRQIILRGRHPYITSQLGLQSLSEDGVAGSLKFTNGNVSTDFQFGAMQQAAQHPNAQNQGKLLLPSDIMISASSIADDITVVNDATP